MGKWKTRNDPNQSGYGEQHYRQRFPNSNRYKTVYFANGSKGEKRLEYMQMPIPE